MQKKKLYQCIAAAALVAAVAAALILFGTRGGTPASGSADEAFSESAASSEDAESGSASAASSAAASESASGSESASLSGEEDASSELEELEEEIQEEIASSAASSEKAGSTASSASSSASSAAHSQPASSAASSSHAASSAASSSHASSAASSESAVDAQIKHYVRQLENLRDQTESKLYGVIYEAYNEYIAHPEEERSLGLKVSIVVSKTAKLTSVQSECDKEFNAILKELRQYLRDNGRDQTVADDAEKEYKKMKSDLTSQLTSIVYNSAVGSGDGGKWIQENIEHKR